MGCLFSQRDAHIYCENGHLDAYIHVSNGIGLPIRENSHPGWDAYIHLTLALVKGLVPVGYRKTISSPMTMDTNQPANRRARYLSNFKTDMQK